jgi:hypothetical protein
MGLDDPQILNLLDERQGRYDPDFKMKKWVKTDSTECR